MAKNNGASDTGTAKSKSKLKAQNPEPQQNDQQEEAITANPTILLDENAETLETTEYGKFKFVHTNRPVSEKLVAQLVESIKNFGFIPGRQVLVNENFGILDGQHRFMACKKLKIAVPYSIVKGDSDAITMTLNSNQSPWKLADFIHSWAEQGRDDYRKLLKFEEKYKLGMSSSIDVFIRDSIKKSNDIKHGRPFPINEDAEQIAEFILQCSSVSFHKTQKFCRSIIVLFKKATPEQREHVKLNIITVPQCFKVEQYVTAYENILSGGARGKGRVQLQKKK